MKNVNKKGILAGMILEQLNEEQVAILMEQEQETKPSRLQNKKFKQPKNKRHKKDYDTFH